jgi:hypothetical protein
MSPIKQFIIQNRESLIETLDIDFMEASKLKSEVNRRTDYRTSDISRVINTMDVRGELAYLYSDTIAVETTGANILDFVKVLLGILVVLAIAVIII